MVNAFLLVINLITTSSILTFSFSTSFKIVFDMKEKEKKGNKYYWYSHIQQNKALHTERYENRSQKDLITVGQKEMLK